MNRKAQNNQVSIKKTTISSVAEVLKVYRESTDDLKKKMMGAWPLTTKLGLFHLYLSTTPFFYFLLFPIKSYVAFFNDRAVGFAFIIIKKHKHEKLLGIFVSEDFQGRGIGNRLLSTILEGEDDVELNVDITNTHAIQLYEKMGFQKEGTLQNMRFKQKNSK
jgi:ribosomal protein S18 acetylase RimI-like enzyme